MKGEAVQAGSLKLYVFGIGLVIILIASVYYIIAVFSHSSTVYSRNDDKEIVYMTHLSTNWLTIFIPLG